MNCELICSVEVVNPELSDVTETVIHLIGFLRDHGVADNIFLTQFELAITEAIGKVYHVGHGNVDDAASWSVPLPAVTARASTVSGAGAADGSSGGSNGAWLPRGARSTSISTAESTSRSR